MTIYPIETGTFKLDGGAMFGVVPKKLWGKNVSSDENNLSTWSMRCLLIEQGNRLILIDTGIGDKQSDKFFSHYFLSQEVSLKSSIESLGFHFDDITDVVLTHLHFDHCGGAISWNKDRTMLYPTFKNAIYWSCQEHWEWATRPNAREKASFLSENMLPLQESGQLKFISKASSYIKDVFPSIDVLFVDGHTESQIIPHIHYKGKEIVYMADLIPSTHHIPLPYVPSYDIRPLLTLDEKDNFLRHAVTNDSVLFFEHDFDNECCTVKSSEKGIRPDEVFKLSDLA